MVEYVTIIILGCELLRSYFGSELLLCLTLDFLSAMLPFRPKEFVASSGSEDKPMSAAEVELRRDYQEQQSSQRHSFPGGVRKREAVLRLGVGNTLPTPERHIPAPVPSFVHGTLRESMGDRTALAFKRKLSDIERNGPEWERRRGELEASQAATHNSSDPQPSEKHELAIASFNFGNITRRGQTPYSGRQAPTLLPNFLLGDHAQICLIQEASTLLGRRFQLQRFQQIINGGDASDQAILLATRLCSASYSILESREVNPYGAKIASLQYMIVRIDFSQSDGSPFLYSGRPDWTVGSFHLNNVQAKKPDVAAASYKTMLEDCIRHRVLYMAGDANQSLSRGFLQKAIDSNVPSSIQYQLLSHSDDCVVGIAFFYPENNTVKKVRLCKETYEHYELHLRPGDCDGHRPLKVFFGDGKRDRAQASKMYRDRKSRLREHSRRDSAAASSTDHVAAASSSTDHVAAASSSDHV